MVKRLKQDERIRQLERLRGAPKAEVVPDLTAALRSNAAAEVSVAARLAEEMELVELVPALEAALRRMIRADARHRSSVACVAAASACDALGSRDVDLFLECCRTPELDPSGALRERALFALFRLQAGEAMLEAARLLADRNVAGRVAAARAVANANPLAGVPLLRFKALMGGEEPEVLEHVLDSLRALDSEGFVPFAAGLLGSKDEALANAAAMALGHSRDPAGCAPLIDWADTLLSDKLDLAFSALAILRQPRATQYLLEQIREASVQRAQLAVLAMSPFLYDQTLLAQVREAAGKRGEVLRLVARVSERSAHASTPA